MSDTLGAVALSRLKSGQGVTASALAGQAKELTRTFASEWQRAAELTAAWDSVNYPLNPTITINAQGAITSDCGFNPLGSTAYATIVASPVVFHVFPDGSDTSGDGSFANPFKTPNKAITAGNAGAQPFTIRWYGYTKASGATKTPAYYSRNNGATLTTPPTQPCRILFHGPVVGGISDAYTWTQPDATAYPLLWQTSVADVSRAINPQVLDRFGNPSTYTVAPSTAACAGTPGSVYFNAGGLQGHSHDGSPVTDFNCRVFRVAYALSWTSFTPAGSIFMHADPVEGGSLDIGGAISIRPTGVPASKNILYLADIRNRYAGGKSDAKNAIEVYSWHGLYFAERISGGACSRDFLNVHNLLAANGCKTHFLPQNCVGRDMGLGGNSQNFITAHEDVVSFIGGDIGTASSGGTYAFIDNTLTYLFGVIGNEDRGDGYTLLANDVNAAEIRTEGSARVWGERCILNPIPGNPSVYCFGGSILLRNCWYPSGSLRVRSGIVGTF